jgi:hypothetical protein
VDGIGKKGNGFHVDRDRDARAAGHLERVAGQPETGDVGARVNTRCDHRPGRWCVERDHLIDEESLLSLVEGTVLHRRRVDACAERLRQDDRVARPGARCEHDVVGMDRPHDREAVLQLGIHHRMAADDYCTSLVHLVGAAPHQELERLYLELPFGESDDVERRYGLASHRVDVAHRVRRGDLPEHVRIVNYCGEEIYGDDDRPVIAYAHYAAVIRLVRSDDQVGMALGGEFL